MPRVVFVTGGTGYVGRHIVPQLLARGHRVRLLVRPGSESKAPPGAEVLVGNPFNRASIAPAIAPADTFLQLVGVPHPSPSKTRQFVDIDLQSALESIAAARASTISHFVYVSVAQPAPIMRAYQEVRAQAERTLATSGLRYTVLRPWYVLGPGHWWPYALLPAYWALERLPSTRDSARQLGLITIGQMTIALVDAIENQPEQSRFVEVPEIRRLQTRS